MILCLSYCSTSKVIWSLTWWCWNWPLELGKGSLFCSVLSVIFVCLHRKYFVWWYFGSIRKLIPYPLTYWFSTISWSLLKLILLGLTEYDFSNSIFLHLLTSVYKVELYFTNWGYWLPWNSFYWKSRINTNLPPLSIFKVKNYPRSQFNRWWMERIFVVLIFSPFEYHYRLRNFIQDVLIYHHLYFFFDSHVVITSVIGRSLCSLW